MGETVSLTLKFWNDWIELKKRLLGGNMFHFFTKVESISNTFSRGSNYKIWKFNQDISNWDLSSMKDKKASCNFNFSVLQLNHRPKMCK